MAQEDYSVANASGASVRADINAQLAAIVSLNSGASAPSTTFAYMLWADTTNGVLKRRNAANSGWLVVAPLASTMVQAKTANYTVLLGDYGTLIDCTSGTFTLSLTAAATLGDGFAFSVRNSGTGIITIDPNSSETIDGATTIAVGQGEAFSIECNGSAFKTVGRLPASRGALVYRTSTQSVPNNTTTAVQFDNEERDTDAVHDNVTNNTRLTVPSGVTKVRLRGQVEFAGNATGSRFVAMNKSGSSFTPRPMTNVVAANSGYNPVLLAVSPVLTVTSGDYFELVAFQDSGSALNIAPTSGQTWFEMEIVD